ncbi:hypothetical protein LN996_00615 [Arthrobacter sp. AK01]|uniref:hypothetical protein n=1 Tax=Micrococcaceae TaxID=1268 RepID=UPI001E4F6DD7|nr:MULTISPECIES: hypothetical protein [Micrococcaceae]MCD4849303.1 hypothetical protein [Arthrobacter sp. AK01]MCP1414691.1 hypothetical protein [Paenarthrobacter sp. A20]
MAMPMVMLLVACTAPSSQPTPGNSTPAPSSDTATAGPSQSSSAPGSRETGDPGPSAGDDDPGRFSYRCTSLDASPEVQLSSLAEVWAANNYTRMDSCEVTYAGEEPFVPTPREAEAISTAAPQGAVAEDGLAAMQDVLRLCTRISDETGPGGFEEASHGTLLAAAAFCPDAPQGKIIAGWAQGTRVGDGSHVVGETVEAGGVQLVKPGALASECTWSVAAQDGSVVASGGVPEAGKNVELEAGQNFTSDKCGIWGKMY